MDLCSAQVHGLEMCGQLAAPTSTYSMDEGCRLRVIYGMPPTLKRVVDTHRSEEQCDESVRVREGCCQGQLRSVPCIQTSVHLP